jgi:4-hydroxymandelate oxidase
MYSELDSFLGWFDDPDIDWLLAHGHMRNLSAGEVLVDVGVKPEAIYVLVEGKLSALIQGMPPPGETLMPGALVGGLAYLDSSTTIMSVTALSTARILVLPRMILEDRCGTVPKFAGLFYQALGANLANRIRATIRMHTSIESSTTLAGVDTIVTMAHLFREACEKFAQRPAYRVDEKWITYSQVRPRIERLAGSVAALQPATEGQAVIATLLPNCEPLMEVYFASALSGSIVFPINYRLSGAELQGILRTSGAGVLVTSSAFAPLLSQIETEQIPMHTIVWLDESSQRLPGFKNVHWEALLSVHLPPISALDPAPEAYLQCFGTSGTTGTPKVILHSHLNVVEHTFATIDALSLNDNDLHCWGHFGPMFHVGDAAFVWIGMMLGARHVFSANPLDLKEVIRTIAEDEVSICKISPSMLKLIVLSGTAKGMSFPFLRWILTGGAAADPTLVRKTMDVFGCDFIQGYGMTEITCHASFKNETKRPLEEGMVVLPNLSLKIIDETHSEVPAGTVGEVAIRGLTVFQAQLADGKVVPALKQGFTEDGFFLSGDLGYLDVKGGLHISGRNKDMINVGGENVFASEVEMVVSGIQDVKQCAAFSVPHPDLGEVVELAVICSTPSVTAERVVARCKQLLASYKVPRRVHFLNELPLTPTGKVRKAELREQLITIKAQQMHEVQQTSPNSTKQDTREIILQILRNVGVNNADITDEASLFNSGLDSLGALFLIEQLQTSFGVQTPASLLYENPTIGGLVAHFKELAPRSEAQPEERVHDKQASPTPEAEPTIGRPLAAPIALGLQILSLLIRPGLFVFSTIPVLLAAQYLANTVSSLVLFLLGPLLLGAVLVLSMVGALCVKWALLGRQRSGRFALGGIAYHRWLAVNNLFRSLEPTLGVLRGSGALNVFYRFCGARIARDARIYAADLQDLDLIEVGAGAYIARDANLQPALLTGNALVLNPVHIGERAVIGQQASVFGPANVSVGHRVPGLDTGPGEASPGVPSLAPPLGVRLLGYLLVAYTVTGAIGVTAYLMTRLAQAPDLLALFGCSGNTSVNLVFFVLLAVGTQAVLPAVYFLLVVVWKRLLLGRLEPGETPAASHWIYSRLIDVPHFMVFLRLNVMSHAMKWWYQLLGTRVGARPFIAAPYTAEPELVVFSDGAMVAGNVCLFPHDPLSGATSEVTLASRAIVANSCLLMPGARLSESSLLGDLSRYGGDDVSPPGGILVGRPPRVVGETKLGPDACGPVTYAGLQGLLIVLQLVLVVGLQIPGFILLGLALRGLSTEPGWLVAAMIPLALLLPRGMKVLLLPAAKWLVLGRVKEGEHRAYGMMWIRWIAMEALLMDLERTLLLLRGTKLLPLLYRALGATVGTNTWLFSSCLGSEYDLKTIEAGSVLNHRSLLFGHSIERHTLIFRNCKAGQDSELGAFSIIEAGAVVANGTVIPPHRAVHASRQRVDANHAATELLVNFKDFEIAARAKLPAHVFDYYAGGAGDQLALRRNTVSFDRVIYPPRVLVDVGRISTKCDILKKSLSYPVIIAPMAMHQLAHPDGEIAVSRACRKLGVGMVLSTLSTRPVEEVVTELGDEVPGLLQLYMLKDREMTERLVQRAATAGCKALVLTVDAPVSGRREADIRNRFSIGAGLSLPHLDGIAGDANSRVLAFEHAKDPTLSWDDLVWLLKISRSPVWLKGVMRPDDALRALDLGVSGIVLSNHGGRQFDSAPSALEVLPLVRKELDRGGYHVPLLVDGGVRRGEHIFKALALGADAVLVGRPVLWGLATDGEAGVSRVLSMLREEFTTAMRLAGCPRLEDIDQSAVIIEQGPSFASTHLQKTT